MKYLTNYILSTSRKDYNGFHQINDLTAVVGQTVAVKAAVRLGTEGYV